MYGPASWNATRLAELSWSTQFFINEDAGHQVTVALVPTRKVAIAKAGGGHDFEPEAPKSPQTFRLVRQTTFDGIELSPNDDGMSRKFAYMIIAPATADIEIGDTWDENMTDGTVNHYHVDSIEPASGYEIRASVTAFAKEPQHG